MNSTRRIVFLSKFEVCLSEVVEIINTTKAQYQHLVKQHLENVEFYC